MGKVKVSKKLEDELKDFLVCNSKEELLIIHTKLLKEGKSWNGFVRFNNLSILEMAEVLINGYEVEETKEDETLKLFKFSKNQYEKTGDLYYKGSFESILDILDIFSIEIEGINK